MYAFVFTSSEHLCRFLLISSKIVFALEVMLSMWGFHLRSRCDSRKETPVASHCLDEMLGKVTPVASCGLNEMFGKGCCTSYGNVNGFGLP